MTGLVAGFASSVFCTQGIVALQAVAGGWLAAIGVVLVEAFLQLGNPSFELGE